MIPRPCPRNGSHPFILAALLFFYGAGGQDQRGLSRPYGPHCDVGAVERIPLFFIYMPAVFR